MRRSLFVWVVLVGLSVVPRASFAEMRLLDLRSAHILGCETDGGPEKGCQQILGPTRERLVKRLAALLADHPYECVGDKTRRSFDMIVGYEYNDGDFFVEWGPKNRLIKQLPPCERTWVVQTTLYALKAVHEIDLRYRLRLSLAEKLAPPQLDPKPHPPWQEREAAWPCVGRWEMVAMKTLSKEGECPADLSLPLEPYPPRSVTIRHRLNGRHDYVACAATDFSGTECETAPIEVQDVKVSGDECRIGLWDSHPGREAVGVRYELAASGTTATGKATALRRSRGQGCELKMEVVVTVTRPRPEDLVFDTRKVEADFQNAWQIVKESCKVPAANQALPRPAQVTVRISPWGGLEELTLDGVQQRLWDTCDRPATLWYRFDNPTGEFQDVTFDAMLE